MLKYHVVMTTERDGHCLFYSFLMHFRSLRSLFPSLTTQLQDHEASTSSPQLEVSLSRMLFILCPFVIHNVAVAWEMDAISNRWPLLPDGRFLCLVNWELEMSKNQEISMSTLTPWWETISDHYQSIKIYVVLLKVMNHIRHKPNSHKAYFSLDADQNFYLDLFISHLKRFFMSSYDDECFQEHEETVLLSNDNPSRACSYIFIVIHNI
jgi:hypothetical protein